MSNEVQISPLDTVADVVDSRHKTPKYSDSGHPMVRVVDITGGLLDLSKTKKVEQDVFDDFSKGISPKEGDLIITRVGSYGNIAYTGKNMSYCLGQNTAFILPKKINWRFLYYQLISPFVKNQIELLVVGAVQKTISLKSIKELEIKIPPLEEQKQIAHILGTLDDKIELNRKMNETLEAMAQAMFKSWFVDFDPVMDNLISSGNEIPEALQTKAEKRKAVLESGKYKKLPSDIMELFPSSFEWNEELEKWIPEGWEVKTIDDVATVVGGGTPSTKIEDYYCESKTGISWLSPKDLSGYNWRFISNGATDITELGLQKSSAKLMPKNSVLFSSRAPIGYIAISGKEVSTNQGFKSLVPNEGIPTEYLFQFMKNNTNEIESIASGSTFKEVSGSAIKGFAVLLPSTKVLKRYKEENEVYHSKFESIHFETDKLINTRDLLLPKLISGQILISKK